MMTVLASGGHCITLVPTTCAPGRSRLDLQAQHAACRQDLQLLAGSPGEVMGVKYVWCPEGRLLAVCREELRPLHAAQRRCLSVSIFSGAELVGSFVEPLGYAEICKAAPHVSAGAAAVFFPLDTADGVTRVVAASARGIVTARHGPLPVLAWTLAHHSTCLAGVSRSADALYVCGSDSMLVISLVHFPTDHVRSLASGWGRLVSVCAASGTASAGHALLLVDLAEQRLVQCCNLDPASVPQNAPGALQQGACSAAVQLPPVWPNACPEGSKVCILSTAGPDFGRQSFAVPGSCFQWDPMGRFLAVGSLMGGVSVVDGRTGTPLASWMGLSVPYPGSGWRSQPRWLPDGTGLVCEQLGPGSLQACQAACVLTFAGAEAQQ